MQRIKLHSHWEKMKIKLYNLNLQPVRHQSVIWWERERTISKEKDGQCRMLMVLIFILSPVHFKVHLMDEWIEHEWAIFIMATVTLLPAVFWYSSRKQIFLAVFEKHRFGGGIVCTLRIYLKSEHIWIHPLFCTKMQMHFQSKISMADSLVCV